MQVDAAMIVGAIASAGSMTAFAPQAWRIIKTRDTKGLSASTFALNTAAFALWAAYGMLLGKWPIIITNSVCLVVSGFILVMRLLPAHRRDAVADKLDPAVRT